MENRFQHKIHSKPNYQYEQRIKNFRNAKSQKLYPLRMLIDNVLHAASVKNEENRMLKEDSRREELRELQESGEGHRVPLIAVRLKR